TALGRALCAIGGASSVVIELESHGRADVVPQVDLSRSVGWFTYTHPVRLSPGSGPIGATIQAVKEQLRGVPRDGLGFGLLARAPDGPLGGIVRPEITFNYLGQLDLA